ncbi:hypothetical protein F4805DRAFT_431493 [Annulohypoxylon moriforme]|nr:hypothetical protein F4805DRAFT_431493 [Annulohypoxylon moriforme]
MFPVTSMATIGGRQALFHTPPRGTCSRIISLRLHRHSRATTVNLSSFRRLYASSTPVHATDPISSQEFDLFRDFLRPNANKSSGMAAPSVTRPSIDDLTSQFAGPLRKVLLALRQGDTWRLIINIRLVLKMDHLEIQEAIAALPRTTITEILRALDPVKISRDIDPTAGSNITPGMYQLLGMGSYVDDWGTRKIYLDLLEFSNHFVAALKATGQALQTEEYTSLLRCAGAASDLGAARWLWDDMNNSQTEEWRQPETFDEYMSSRFLTRPLYNSYDRVRRVVTPRDLHRARVKLDQRYVSKLDRLRFNVRTKRMYFGLNKGKAHAEDLQRTMRKNRPATRFYYSLLKGNHVEENLLYTAMTAFARAGSLRFIGSKILRHYFGIHLGRLVYEERGFVPNDEIKSVPSPMRPSYRLMGAIVDAYGSNGEIALAYQIIDHISRSENIRIPRSVWHELLEWTYIMSSPPVSTMWKQADMHFKIPDPSAVEIIFDTMAEYGIKPRFEAYNILVRNLVGRHQFSKVPPLIRKLVEFYDEINMEYQDMVFEYAQLIRDGVSVSEAISRFERVRFLKARMWYDIQTICRQFLLKVRSHSLNNPLTSIAVPNFINEFRPFIPNPATYRTSTGYVSLFDPARAKHQVSFVRHLPMAIPMKHNGKWVLQGVKARRVEMTHEHSLRGHLPMAKLGLAHLLSSTSRARLPPREVKVSQDKSSDPSEDDDDFF